MNILIIQFIKDYFKNVKFSVSSCRSFLMKNEQVKKEAENILLSIPEYQSLHHIIEYALYDMQLPICKNCGKYLTATQHKIILRRNGHNYCKVCNALPEIKKTIRLNALPKFKQTMLGKYGVQFSVLSEQIQQKRRKTCLEKYGSEYAISSSNVREKIKQTCLDKYGVENITKLNKSEFFDKCKIFRIQPLFSKEDFLNDLNKDCKIYEWKCLKCGNNFSTHIHKTLHIPEFPYLPRCLNCYPFNVGQSNMERQVVDFISEIFPGNIETKDRKIIAPYQLDIVIPQKKIAIQFNGSYWHASQFKDKNYHLNKTQMCQKNGYKLIHIFQYDWLQKKDIIKAKLKAILGIDQVPIYARKCQIKQITTKQKNIFLNLHHIQGEDKSKIKLGLFYKNQLVAVMTFGKPRFNKNYQFQLIRYASKSGYRVLGGAGKLLKYFQKNYNPKSIITYADRSYSQGNMYKQLGFNLLNISEPNYCYLNHDLILSRYQCQKSKLKNILKNFNSNLTQSENMSLNGFTTIYDCGNLIFVKNFVSSN